MFVWFGFLNSFKFVTFPQTGGRECNTPSASKEGIQGLPYFFFLIP
jgi:hypothetical protein